MGSNPGDFSKRQTTVQNVAACQTPRDSLSNLAPPASTHMNTTTTARRAEQRLEIGGRIAQRRLASPVEFELIPQAKKIKLAENRPPSAHQLLQGPTPEPSQYSSQQREDEEVVILKSPPCTPKFKKEDSAPVTKHIFNVPGEAIAAIRLSISASTQRHIAPSIVRMTGISSIDELFSRLTSKLGISSHVAEKVSTISATYVWNNQHHRLCRNDPDDFEMLGEFIKQAWEKENERFLEQPTVRMLLHVDS